MKRLAFIITLALVLVSCGSRNGYFSLDGHLLNLNQGEFYVYSPDGVFDGVDTIKVDGGRFVFETPCKQRGTIIIVFPNFSEQPVFAEPGKSVTVKGDASHLKEIEINGTDDNELMNSFRQQIAKASPPEVIEHAERFIMNNPESPVSVYILKKHFITNAGTGTTNGSTDYQKIAKLADVIYKKQPKNGEIARIITLAGMMKRGSAGSNIPSFSERDINGKTVTDANLRGRIAVVCTWADWNFESRSMYSRLEKLSDEYGNRLAVLGISLDASVQTCKNALRNDTTGCITICDQQMFDSQLLDKFAFTAVGENIIFNAQGRAIERGLDTNALETKLKSLLNL